MPKYWWLAGPRSFFYFCGVRLWVLLPNDLQFFLSRLFSAGMKLKASRYWIYPYAALSYSGDYDFSRFAPASGGERYASFQDFFIRRLKLPVLSDGQIVWPCDGSVCDVKVMHDQSRVVRIKREQLSLKDLFQPFSAGIPENYVFTNIFLHNTDYHRIHSPLAGIIRGVERVPGALRFLRPWAYKDTPKCNPSIPALTNERVNVWIEPSDGSPHWYLSIVGGPGVATIILGDATKTGARIHAGQELAHFELGSTLCVASPCSLGGVVGRKVQAGKRVEF